MAPKKLYLIVIFYFILAFILYSPVIGSFFVSDDFDWLARAKGLDWSRVFLVNADGNQESGVYRPLTNVSFWLDYQIFGLNSLGYHITNLLFFFLTASALFWLIFLLTRQTALSFLAGLFFIVLPNHPEAVSWISGRGDVLAAFFYLLSFISYFYFRQRNRFYFLSLSLAAFLLALLSKEMAITLPAVILLMELFFPFGRAFWQRWIGFLSFSALLTAYLAARFLATGLFYGFYASSRLSFSTASSARAMIKALSSNFLAGEGGRLFSNLAAGHWLVSSLIILAIFLLLIRFLKEKKLFLFGSFFFILTMAPVLSLRFSSLTSEGERFAYLPSLGISLILALLSWTGLRRFFFAKFVQKIALAGALIIFIFYLGFNLFQKNLIWQKAGTLSQKMLADFVRESGLKKGEGFVILGLPDNLDGAFVFRNGWLNALAIFYPDYSADVLTVKVGLNLSTRRFGQKAAVWRPLADGFKGQPFEAVSFLFSGPESLVSLDYLLKISGYDRMEKAGQEAEIRFTPAFISQFSEKPIHFLAMEGEGMKKIAPFISVHNAN